MGVDQRKFYTIKRLEALEQEAQAQYQIAEALYHTLSVRVNDFSLLLTSAEEAEKQAQNHYNNAVHVDKKFKEVQKLTNKAADNSDKAFEQIKTVFSHTYQVARQTVQVANATVRLAEVVQTQAEKNPLISSFIQNQTGDTTASATTAVHAILAALDKVALAMEDSFAAQKSTQQSADATVELNPLITYNLWTKNAANEFVPVSFDRLKYDSAATVESILSSLSQLYVMVRNNGPDKTTPILLGIITIPSFNQGAIKALHVNYDPSSPANLQENLPLFTSTEVEQGDFANVLPMVPLWPSGTDQLTINETSSVMGIETLLLIRLEKAQKLVFERKTALELAQKMLTVATKNLAVKETAYEAAQEKLEAAKQAVNYPA